MLLTNARIATMDPAAGPLDTGGIVMRDGRIAWVGAMADMPDGLWHGEAVDLCGRLVTPALIDCHTHIVHGGHRADEFRMRLEGASYEEVARAGGGIVSTVAATRAASMETLLKQALRRVDVLLAEGVGLIEVKSGYGLDRETELKMLRVARCIADARPVRVRTSFLGAHAVPAEYRGRADAYLDEVCLPTLEAAQAEGLVDAVDGFCEGIAFAPDQIARLFDRAGDLGLPVKLHAEQLSNLGGAALAARYGALSADHLEYATDEDAAAMAAAGTVAVLLPGAFYTLRETQAPPVAAFRAAGVPMAVATDSNPGSSPLTSLLLAMNMAATLFRLTPDECLAGVTRVAARALGLADCGRIAEPRAARRPLRVGCREPGGTDLPHRLQPAVPPLPRGRAMLTLVPGSTPLADLRRVWDGAALRLDPGARPGIEAAAALVARAASGGEAVYGVNTGFGKLASVKIAAADTATLQRNLILSHCAGVGAPLDADTIRLMMALKLLSLGRGASGTVWATVALIEAMLDHGVTPVIPEQGSVGASGDLAPLAHMAAVMIGEGEAILDGRRMPGRAALEAAGLAPIVLGPKEGLALINGTQFSTALALAGLWQAHDVARAAVVTGALSTDAIMGSTAPLVDAIQTLRGHAGQIDVARAQARLMEGSAIRESHREGDTRVQDPYCIRCQPQVTGACLDLLRFAARTLETEANAVTDNPLVLVDQGLIVSGGNFHAEPVAFAADQIALALAEIGAIAQRRVALLVDPTLSFDLPPFLTPDPGLNSGLMIAEVTTAALMSENKHMANPCSTDSTPTSANQEDHVSMAAHGARRLGRMAANLRVILGVEAICAAQGIHFRAPLRTSPALQAVIARLRTRIPVLGPDRYLAPDLETAAAMIGDRTLIEGLDLPGIDP